MSSWAQRPSWHWITSVDPCCPLPLPSSLSLSPALSPSQVITQWAVHYTMHMVVSTIGLLCFCCLYLFCCSNSVSLCLPPSLFPSLPLQFLSCILSCSLHPCPLSCSVFFLTHPPPSSSFSSLSFCGFVSFHQVSKWLYWWSLSNLRYGQFLPYVNFLFCHSVRLSLSYACTLSFERLLWFPVIK